MAAGHAIRRGAVTADGNGEAVMGLGFMLMGENSHGVTNRLKEKLDEISREIERLDGDGKIQILPLGRLVGHHTDHCAIPIENRTTAGTPGNRSCQLQHLAACRQIPNGRDDAFGDGLFQSHGTANHENPIGNVGFVQMIWLLLQPMPKMPMPIACR